MKWKPDTCDCIIECQSGNIGYISSVKKCNLHKRLPSNQAHLNAVLAHNKTFNRRYGRNPTKTQQEQVSTDKDDERERINNLP